MIPKIVFPHVETLERIKITALSMHTSLKTVKRQRGRRVVSMPTPSYLWSRLCDGMVLGAVGALCDLKLTKQRKKSQPNQEGREEKWRQPESFVTLLNF